VSQVPVQAVANVNQPNLAFSKKNGRLTPENQDMMLRVKLNGNIDVQRAFGAWNEAKKRKL